MPTPGIVKPLDVIEHIRFGLIPGLVVSPVGAFNLECREKAFHSGVIPTVVTATHAAGHTVFSEQVLELFAGVLAALIRMMQQRTGRR